MNEPTTVPDDDRELFARLRRMWTARDPMPEGLIDDILVRLATEDLGTELALLTLVAESSALAGVRGPSDNHTFEFSDGETTLLLRVSSAGAGARRIDGWLAPAAAATIHLEGAAGETTADAGPDGRFAFAEVPEGTVRIRFRLRRDEAGAGTTAGGGASGGGASGEHTGYTTLEFEL